MRRLVMTILLIYLVIKAQLPINNKNCPVGIAKRVREISDDYLNTFWEHQRLLEERENIKKKYKKEIQDVKDQYNPSINKLERENKRLSGMIDGMEKHVIDCKWYHQKDPTLKSGLYELSVFGLVFTAYCKMWGEEYIWTLLYEVFQGDNASFDSESRKAERTMNHTWQEYKDGFGKVGSGNGFWLGNEKLHRLTKDRPADIYVSYLTDFYSSTMGNLNCTMLSETRKYRIICRGVRGMVGMGRGGFLPTLDRKILDTEPWLEREVENPINAAFSTYDKDNDGRELDNCAAVNGIGWWYGDDCHVIPPAYGKGYYGLSIELRQKLI